MTYDALESILQDTKHYYDLLYKVTLRYSQLNRGLQVCKTFDSLDTLSWITLDEYEQLTYHLLLRLGVGIKTEQKVLSSIIGKMGHAPVSTTRGLLALRDANEKLYRLIVDNTQYDYELHKSLTLGERDQPCTVKTDRI